MSAFVDRPQQWLDVDDRRAVQRLEVAHPHPPAVDVPGRRFEEVRPIIRAAWRQAQAVKHRDEPNRTDAGIAADTTALLVAIVRRLADEDVPPAKPDEDDDIPF
jgi:hypothetical protein